MERIQYEEGKGVLNETTMTVHKREVGSTALRTVCGHTHHVEHDRLQVVEIERALEGRDATKCGGCFEGGRGY